MARLRGLGRLVVPDVPRGNTLASREPSLAFNSDLVPENGMRPRPGLPLQLLYVACVVSPLVVVATSVMQARDD